MRCDPSAWAKDQLLVGKRRFGRIGVLRILSGAFQMEIGRRLRGRNEKTHMNGRINCHKIFVTNFEKYLTTNLRGDGEGGAQRKK